MKIVSKWASRGAWWAILAAASTPAMAGLQKDYGTLTAPGGDDQTQQLIITMRDQSPEDIPRRVRELGASAAMALSHVRRMSGNAHVVRLERRVNHADARRLARLLALDPRVQAAEQIGRAHV